MVRKGSEVHIPNGSYIEFFSADQPDKVKGPRRDIAYLNECDLMPFMTYHHIMIRTNKITMMDFNPSHTFWRTQRF